LDPIKVFEEWYSLAQASESDYPDAMSLATSSPDGFPHVRIVLMKAFDERGFTFYTNLGSAKSQELIANPRAALCFHWKSLKKQVRIEGIVEPVSDEEADEYFASRPRVSQLGAWASKQSQALESRLALEKRVAEFTAKFHIGKIPRPDFWSGYRLKPTRIEFWEEKPFRLHDRIVHTRTSEGEWTNTRLYP
jgi:pyridoxamine 5'-phosphate oxidase